MWYFEQLPVVYVPLIFSTLHFQRYETTGEQSTENNRAEKGDFSNINRKQKCQTQHGHYEEPVIRKRPLMA